MDTAMIQAMQGAGLTGTYRTGFSTGQTAQETPDFMAVIGQLMGTDGTQAAALSENGGDALMQMLSQMMGGMLQMPFSDSFAAEVEDAAAFLGLDAEASGQDTSTVDALLSMVLQRQSDGSRDLGALLAQALTGENPTAEAMDFFAADNSDSEDSTLEALTEAMNVMGGFVMTNPFTANTDAQRQLSALQDPTIANGMATDVPRQTTTGFAELGGDTDFSASQQPQTGSFRQMMAQAQPQMQQPTEEMAATQAQSTFAPTEGISAPQAQSDLAPTEGIPAPQAQSNLAPTEGMSAPQAQRDLATTEGMPAPQAQRDLATTEGMSAPQAQSNLAPTEGTPAPQVQSNAMPTEGMPAPQRQTSSAPTAQTFSAQMTTMQEADVPQTTAQPTENAWNAPTQPISDSTPLFDTPQAATSTQPSEPETAIPQFTTQTGPTSTEPAAIADELVLRGLHDGEQFRYTQQTKQKLASQDTEPVADTAMPQVQEQRMPTEVRLPEPTTEAPATPEEAASIYRQTLDILSQSKADEQRFSLKLTPEGLGEITVEMTKSTDGQIVLSMAASTTKAANALNEQLGALQTALGQNVEISAVTVARPDSTAQFSAFSEQFQDQQNGAMQYHQQEQYHGWNAPTAEEAAERGVTEQIAPTGSVLHTYI